ncbi:MAG: peptidylprolyl isomerase [Bacteroidetes bacterium]|nr:peptidylprolyl isomerase [Bacteroidota bacterium]
MKKTLLIALIFTIMAGFSATAQTKFVIKTSMGDIHGILYDETPGHRDNFIKLANEGWYDGSRFHRVIRDFMIQGGGNKDGQLDPGYSLPAEIVPDKFHKRGALAAARMGDEVNPERKSSGCQFYIVQGRKFGDEELNAIEQRFNMKMSTKQRQAYKSSGGAPHLDGTYTIFGEIISGMDVVDRIASVEVFQNAPIDPVTFSVEIIE